MTVYVDDFRISARVGNINGRWSHLTADTRDELHAFAARLGLRRTWFQDLETKHPSPRPGSFAAESWHYDVTDSKRRQAIRLGAVPVSWDAMPEIIHRRMAGEVPSVQEDLFNQGDQA